MTSTVRVALLSSVAVLAVACRVEPQSTGAEAKKSDMQSWQGAENPYVAPGWKRGDRSSWEDHLRTRTQTQNEYVKIEN